jgi:cell division protein FtsZ
MNPENSPAAGRPVRVKILGLGTAGVAMLEVVARGGFAGAGLVAVDTDDGALARSTAPEKIHLETRLLRGLGTGGDPERGRELAEAHAAQFKSVCAGADAVFLVAGLGGGAGTGIAPVVARVAREAGALALGFVTLPFACEGGRRQQQARAGLEALKAAADGVVCLPCQQIIRLVDENASLVDTFKFTTEFLLDGVRGVWRLLAFRGLIPLHFADLCSVLRDRHGESVFAAAAASGDGRAQRAVEQLLRHPLLEDGAALAAARTALVSVVGGPELKLAEVNGVMEQLQARCGGAELTLGAVVDEQFRDQLALTIIATRPGSRAENPAPPSSAAAASEPEKPALDPEPLRPLAEGKPPARPAPPAPILNLDQRQKIVAQPAARGARGRKTVPRSSQMPLPLEIVSKSRFDRTEATIHNGEDLDMPTYLRRGVAFN